MKDTDLFFDIRDNPGRMKPTPVERALKTVLAAMPLVYQSIFGAIYEEAIGNNSGLCPCKVLSQITGSLPSKKWH